MLVDRAEARNAIDLATMDELEELLDVLEKDRETLAVVLGGAGEEAFIAGGDLKEFQTLAGRRAGLEMSLRMQAILGRLEALDVPSIAAVEGDAYGGGCEVALSCDMRVCSWKASFNFRQVELGIMPGWGGATRLTRLVGRSRALRVLLTAASVGAEEAYRIGLTDEIAEEGQALVEAQALAGRIAGFAPGSVRGIKRSIHRGRDLPARDAIAYEAEQFATTWGSEDHEEGVAAFFEERDPDWKDR